jgi:hypothetical protein
MRLKPRFILPLLIMMLMISYQNFSNVDSSEWDSTTTLKIVKEMNEFEKNNTSKPVLATPAGGSDLKSVSDNWVQRQGAIILNGYDKKLEHAMNDKLNEWVQDITRKDPMSEESAVAKGEGGNPSQSPEEERKRKQNLRFARINSLKYDLGETTCVDLTADPGNTHLNYSQALSSNSKMGLEHRMSDNQTQMFFKYEW